jgi:hypothetical protein
MKGSGESKSVEETFLLFFMDERKSLFCDQKLGELSQML